MKVSKEELLAAHPWMLEGKLSTRAFNILVENGIDSVEKLIAYEPSRLRKFRNCGRKTVNEIRELLRVHQLDLASYGDQVLVEKDAEIERLNDKLEKAGLIIAQCGLDWIKAKQLIIELCDALERHQDLGMTDYDNHTAAIVRKDWKAITAEIDFDLITRAREATR